MQARYGGENVTVQKQTTPFICSSSREKDKQSRR